MEDFDFYTITGGMKPEDLGEAIKSANTLRRSIKDLPTKDSVVTRVDTITKLRSTEPSFDGQQIQLLGHTLKGVGGGTFYADYSNSSSDDNGCTIVTPSGKRWIRVIGSSVTPEMFGATSGNSLLNADAIEKLFIFVSKDRRYQITVDGDFGLHREISLPSANIRCRFNGFLYAMDGFIGEYLISFTSGGQSNHYTPQFYHPLILENLWVKCRFLTRGLRLYNIDHYCLYSPRVENSLGSAYSIDRSREAVILMPLAINCAHRESYPDNQTTLWTPQKTYTTGTIVRFEPPTYKTDTVYSSGDVVCFNKSNWICSLRTSANELPDTNNSTWRKIPHQDYICLLENSNKLPTIHNTNNSDTQSHYWKKVYQDESLFDLTDSIVVKGDRQNQLTIYSPICRDSNNKCLMRIDNNRNSAYNTHINIYSGHLHQIQDEAIGDYPQIVPQSGSRCLEIGRAQNVYVHGTNLFTADRPQGISLLVGDLGSKSPSGLKIDCTISSGGQGQTGIIIMPSVVKSDRNKIDATYSDNTSGNYTQIVDGNSVFKNTDKVERMVKIPNGRNGVPVGVSVEGSYDKLMTRYFAGKVSGDTLDRFRVETTEDGITRLCFGDGVSSPDSFLERKGKSRLSLGAGNTFEVDGTWSAPFCIGTKYLWQSTSGDLRYKNLSKPSADDDGYPVVTLADTPLSPTSKGNKGDISIDGTYMYLCYSKDLWVRVPTSSW